jgi:hypothetical protein
MSLKVVIGKRSTGSRRVVRDARSRRYWRGRDNSLRIGSAT